MKNNSATIVTGGGIGLKGALAARGPREVEVQHVQFARAKGMEHHSVRARAVEHLFLLFLGQAGEKGTKAAKARVARTRDSQGGDRGRVERGYRHLTTSTGKVEMRAGAVRRARGQDQRWSHRRRRG